MDQAPCLDIASHVDLDSLRDLLCCRYERRCLIVERDADHKPTTIFSRRASKYGDVQSAYGPAFEWNTHLV